MGRIFAKMSALFALGFFAATFIPNPPIEVNSSANNLLAETRQAYPVLSANSTSQLTAQGSQLVLSEASINARFTGLLSHVRWLIEQQSKSGSHSSTNSSSHSSGGVDAALFNKQIESLSDDIGDSHRDLLEQLNTIVGVTTDSVSPSSVLSIGKVDEDCLTYEATGDTWEWQTCGTGGSNFATTSINTSLKLASIVTDETGTGALVFAGSPTLTGTLTATNANFSGNIGVGTSTPLAVLDIYKSFNGGTKVNVTNKNLGSSVYSEINLTAGTAGTSWGVNSLASDNGSTYLVAGKELQLYAGANGAVYLNNTTGNFGISSSSPSAKLTVQNTGTGNSFIIEDQAGDATPFVINSNGRVGIGTANPFINNKVSIESNSSDFAHFGLGMLVEGDSLIANSRYGGVDTYVSSKVGNNTNMRYIFGVGSGAAHNGNGVLQELQGNYSYIESTGSGTVTNAMAYDATAYNTSNTSTLSNLTYFKAGNLINNGTITNTYGVYVGDITSGTQTNTPFSFYASDSNANNYFAGNVGIGTTTPTSLLHVAKSVVGGPVATWTENTDNTNTSSNAVLGLAVGGASAGNPFLDFAVSGVTDWSIGVKNNDSDKLYISPNWALSGTPAMVMTTGGNVGIGTTTPNQILTVQGNLNLSSATGAIYFDDTKYLYASSTNDSIVFGENAGATFNSGTTNNIAIGLNAGRYASTSSADDSIYIGSGAGVNNTGWDSHLFGVDAGANNSGYSTNAIGYGAGYNNTNSDNNFFGYNAGYNNIGESGNFFGNSAGYNNTGLYNNNIFGYGAGYNNAGDENNIFGQNAGYNNTGGYTNLFGENAGRNNLGSYNNFFGGSSGYNNTGNYNDFIGYQTGRYLKSTSTVAIGTEALYGGSTYESLNNVALGYRAGYASQNSSGNNILIGYKAADNLTTGNNDIVIGYDIDNVTATADNRLNIGNLIFGTGLDGTGVTLSSGNVGIGSTTPAQKLQVLGNIRIGTSGSNGCLENFGGGVIGGTCSSDEGLKENITPLASSTSTDSYLLGIAGLTPVTYNWNEEAAKLYSKDKTMANIGLTAQDVEAKFPELVSRNDEGYRQVNFTALQFYVIEAIKELWAKVQGHDDRINQLEQENEALKERLSHIEGKLDIQTPSQPAAVIDSTQASTTTPQTDTSTPSVIPPPATEASTTYSLIPGPSQ